MSDEQSAVPVYNRTQRFSKWIERNPHYFQFFIACFFIVCLWSFITASFFLYTIHNPNNISPTAGDVFGGFELTFAAIFLIVGSIMLYRVNKETEYAKRKYGSTTVTTETTLEEDRQYAQRPMQMPQESSSNAVTFSRSIQSGPTNAGAHMSMSSSSAVESLL